MNTDLQHARANLKIKRGYRPSAIKRAITGMKVQQDADVWSTEAAHDLRTVQANVVFDPDVESRWTRLNIGATVTALASAAVLYVSLPALRSGNIAPQDVIAGSIATVGFVLALVMYYHAWRTAHDDPFPGLNATHIEDAHARVEARGERHKAAAAGWEKVLLKFGLTVECGAFSVVSFLGLAYLPTGWAAMTAVALGLAVTGAVATLGRLHAERALIVEGRKMYRRLADLGKALKTACDPEAASYADHADRLRQAISAANLHDFTAPPNRTKLAGLWVLLGALIAATMGLRISFGGDIGAPSIISAGALAIMTASIFWASFRVGQRAMSIGGDEGIRDMKICDLFPSPEAFEGAVADHKQRGERFFRKAVSQASRIHDKVELQPLDPKAPQVRLKFALPGFDQDSPASPTHMPMPSKEAAKTGDFSGRSKADYAASWQVMPPPTMVMRTMGGRDAAE